MAVVVNLVSNGNAGPTITGVKDNATAEGLFDRTPTYEAVIRAGKDARHLWFSLRDWRDNEPERFFGELGAWAEKRMKELEV